MIAAKLASSAIIACLSCNNAPATSIFKDLDEARGIKRQYGGPVYMVDAGPSLRPAMPKGQARTQTSASPSRSKLRPAPTRPCDEMTLRQVARVAI